MIDPFDAIERLVAQAQRRTDLNNEQPHRKKITIADTLEAKAAELISHLVQSRNAPCIFTVERVDAGWAIAEITDDIVIRRLVVPAGGGVFTSTSGRAMMVNDLGTLATILPAQLADGGVVRYELGA